MVFTPKFTSNFIIQVFGRMVATIFGLVAIAILTRLLGPQGFGEYTTAITFLQLFGVIVDFGLTLTLLVMISEPGAHEEKVVGNLVTLRLVSSTVIFAVAAIASWLFPWSNTVKIAIGIGALGYATMAGASLLVGVFQKHQVVWRASIGELLNRVVLLACIGLFAFWRPDPIAMVGAGTIANIAWLFFMVLFAKPFVRITLQFDLAVWKQALIKSWPIAVSILFNLLYLKGDTLLLSLLRTPAEVGLYGAAYRVIDVLTLIPNIFMGLLLPSLVADWAAGKKEEFRLHMRRAFDVSLFLIIPIVVMIQALGEPIARFIAGDEFVASGTVLKLLIWAMLGVFIGALFGHAVVAINKQKPMIWGYAATAVIGIGGYLWLIPSYGMTAAAGITILTEAIIAITTFLVVWKTTGALPTLTTALKAMIASIAMYGVLVFLPAWHVLILIVIGGIAYILFMVTLGGLKISTILELMPQRLASHLKRP